MDSYDVRESLMSAHNLLFCLRVKTGVINSYLFTFRISFQTHDTDPFNLEMF